MAKFMFFGFRKEGLTREQALAEWAGALHSSFVKKLPGVRRWVRNHSVSEAPESAPDWVGERWFDDRAALDACLNSQEMWFANLDKTYGLVVDEQPGIG